jgi:hypothetical protein
MLREPAFMHANARDGGMKHWREYGLPVTAGPLP